MLQTETNLRAIVQDLRDAAAERSIGDADPLQLCCFGGVTPETTIRAPASLGSWDRVLRCVARLTSDHDLTVRVGPDGRERIWMSIELEPLVPTGLRAPTIQAHLERTEPVTTTAPKLLIAEDDPITRTILLAYLQRLSLRADMARSGLEVLRAFESTCYDLVLMNWYMPDGDGDFATRILRERWPVGTGPAIVALTALSGQGVRELSRSRGMDDVLPKPVLLQTLAHMISRYTGWVVPNDSVAGRR